MADTLPIGTDSAARTELIADLQRLRMKRLMVADQQYDVDHLDADSQWTLPGSYPVSYLRSGGQS